MLFVTSQSESAIVQMSNGTYKPSILKSKYALESKVYASGYTLMNKYLSKSMGNSFNSHNCDGIWGFVKNPYISMLKAKGYYCNEKQVLLLVDIPSDRLLLSDYDIWSDLVNSDEFSIDKFRNSLDVDMLRANSCIQAITRDLKWSDVRSVCYLSMLPFNNTVSIKNIVDYMGIYEKWVEGVWGMSSKEYFSTYLDANRQWVNSFADIAIA